MGPILETCSDSFHGKLLIFRVTSIQSLYSFPSTLCSRETGHQNSLSEKPWSTLKTCRGSVLCPSCQGLTMPCLLCTPLIPRAAQEAATTSIYTLGGCGVHISVSLCGIELGWGQKRIRGRSWDGAVIHSMMSYFCEKSFNMWTWPFES